MSAPTTTSPETQAPAPTATRLLQRQVLPKADDFDVIALYVDNAQHTVDLDRGDDEKGSGVSLAFGGRELHPDQLLSRTGFRVRSGERMSFGTYFNAFPASYWRRWTIVKAVELTVRVTGQGASVVVYKSMARGSHQRVDSASTGTEEQGTFTFELTLKPFADGGWYWYDVIAGEADVVVESAEWTAQVPEDKAQHGTLDLAITTMNRPEFCSELLAQLGDDEALEPYLDTVFVMEQGKQKVVDAEAFPAAQEALGDTLKVIEQGNLGGSGGYARGQLESLRKGTADYAMMMDDDVVCEPEGIIRAVTFADLARRPTIVGGHMFNLYARARMHSFGEVVQPWRFWWQSAPGVKSDWDFATNNLRASKWLHQRVDVDFNGWFMCLIPRVVMEDVGLSLPVFIKWDDSEYGLRAKEAGYPTVTFPGAAVWHVPWTDKNDALDWQAYFHVRNRFIAALLHSKYDKGGRLITESRNHQIAHLVSMQYSTAELRHKALLDVLEGPGALHETLATTLPEINAMRKKHTDAQLESDPDAFPPVKRTKMPRKGREDFGPPSPRTAFVVAATQPLRQLRPVRELSRTNPETEIRARDAKWWRLGKFDSAVVSMNDGSSAALYRRDPETFRDMMSKTVAIHARLRREWPRLAQQYQDALGEITSPEAWEQTFRPWTDATDGADD
ncbi:glycosyltransferase [Nocardioides bruguierae]|uniref:glycosyltransferase n=1 Tax=Nocardioides bruguierae TaxID=2945102 RepID=UPI002020F5EB|nr:glycosyltransferase [Nocardioides bruguierae]MCL8027725.1 glycosyltransferase [Nocardioides bruguierae]